jgi:hypothetical protein
MLKGEKVIRGMDGNEEKEHRNDSMGRDGHRGSMSKRISIPLVLHQNA